MLRKYRFLFAFGIAVMDPSDIDQVREAIENSDAPTLIADTMLADVEQRDGLRERLWGRKKTGT